MSCPTIYITKDGLRLTKAGIVRAVFPRRPRNGWKLKRVIGEDIVIQVFTNSTIRVAVQAPRDMTILRGEVLERNGEARPSCVVNLKATLKQSRFHPVDEPVEIKFPRYFSAVRPDTGE